MIKCQCGTELLFKGKKEKKRKYIKKKGIEYCQNCYPRLGKMENRIFCQRWVGKDDNNISYILEQYSIGNKRLEYYKFIDIEIRALIIILLCGREFNQDSYFSKDNLPLDIVKVIFNHTFQEIEKYYNYFK